MKSACYNLYFVWHLGQVVYVGVTKNLKRRIAEHKKAKGVFGQFLRREEGNVEFKIVTIGPRSYIYDLEVKLIVALGVRDVGFNLSAGGIGGRDPHPSTREKISEILRTRSPELHARWWRAGQEAQRGKPRKPVSPETRAKLSEVGRGRKLTPEQKAVLIEARRKIPMSDESRQKLIERNKARVYSEEHKAKSSVMLIAYNKSRAGVPLTLERRLQLSRFHSGRKVSEETRARMREAARETWRRRRSGLPQVASAIE